MCKIPLNCVLLLLAALLFSCSSPGGDVGQDAGNADSTMVENDSLTSSTPTGGANLPDDVASFSPEKILESMFAALAAKDYQLAHKFWGSYPNGYEEFAAQYKDVREIGMTITGEAFTDAAAGTAYASVPVTVSLTMNDGSKKVQKGDYTLTQSNSPDSEDRRWRISTSNLEDGQTVAASGNEEAAVAGIRKEFAAINAAKLTQQKHEIDCGSVTYYLSGKEVRKVKKNWFAGDYGGDEEYYFQHGKLIFAYFWDEGGAANEKVTKQECRYYFKEGNLVRLLPKGPRNCMEAAQITAMAQEVLTANQKKNYASLGCFGD